MDKIAVLIPCFNEESTVAKVIMDAQSALPDAIVYVCDNNSSDKTADIAIDAGAVVLHEQMLGKGNVIRRMFREINAHCYVMIDGDDTYPLNRAAEMAELVLNEKVDMVVGDRLSSTYFYENKRPFHNLGNSMMRRAINHLFKCNIKDIFTGYRAFSYEFVKTFPVLSQGFEIETEMTVHAVFHVMKIDNVVVEYRNRPTGSTSKLNTYRDGSKVLKTIFRLYKDYKPLNFFSFFALVLLLFAIVFMIPVFVDYWQTGEVPRFPTLIVCGFAVIAALQSFFSGLILHNMTLKNRRDFEYRYHQVTEAKRNEKG
jgi:glycosyltransferase involved in cell wall biosynthesis